MKLYTYFADRVITILYALHSLHDKRLFHKRKEKKNVMESKNQILNLMRTLTDCRKMDKNWEFIQKSEHDNRNSNEIACQEASTVFPLNLTYIIIIYFILQLRSKCVFRHFCLMNH